MRVGYGDRTGHRFDRRLHGCSLVAICELDVHQWAELNFGTCDLGDARRTRRAVKVARLMAEHPDGSTPAQCERWADLKAAYRLFDCDEVTFTTLAEPHWQQTRKQARRTVLLIGDTMSTHFEFRRQIEGMKQARNGSARGFVLHNSMMVCAASGEIIGLAGQELFYRQPAPKQTSFQRKKRERESEVWGRVIDLVGPPPEQTRYVHVFDRGADNFEVFCHLVEQRSDWVIRAAQMHRAVTDPDGQRVRVNDLLAQQPVWGTYELEVRGSFRSPQRTARLEVCVAEAILPRPKRMTPYLKQVGLEEIRQSVIEVREIDAPAGVDPLRWVLWTSLPVHSFAAAWRVVEYYERRWLIEEFHKAIKTGCRLESRQYLKSQRLEALAGMMSVLGVRLVQMKMLARSQPDRPAGQVVPKVWLEMLRVLRKGPKIDTLREFFRQLAGLGGHLLRTGDGEPGWLTIWRGLDKLLLAIRGYEAMRKRYG